MKLYFSLSQSFKSPFRLCTQSAKRLVPKRHELGQVLQILKRLGQKIL